MITSTLTKKSQTTIPQPIRNALHLKPGDTLAYRIDGEQVLLSRVPSKGGEDPFATFSEWDTEADRMAYADL